MQYLKNNFFISTISNIQKKSYFDKAYLIDNAYMNLFDSQANLGQKFENTCYKALKKKQSQLGYKDTPYDVDLAIYDTNRQVCYEINEENYERETKFGKYNEANYLITRSKTNFPMNNITQLRYDEFL